LLKKEKLISDISEKKRIILAYEERFADSLALQVLDRPRLSVWMILIPVIFVYYFFQYQKFVTGRKDFTEHYLVSLRRALDEAFDSIREHRDPDITGIAELSDVLEDVLPYQADLLAVRVEHYTKLLLADGDTFEDLLRAAYRSATDLLLFFNRLCQAEQQVNKALLPHLEKNIDGIHSVIGRIEQQSDNLRRDSVNIIFG
jgi:hypothetical protein